MDIAIETLQMFLENAWDDAPDSASSLRQQLRNQERAAGNLFSGGSIGSVSKNSASQSYRSAGVGSYTPAQLQQSYRMLIELYDRENNKLNGFIWLIQNEPTSPPAQWFIEAFPQYANYNPAQPPDADIAVYPFMQRVLKPVYDYQPDVSYLRLEPTAYDGNFIPEGACW